MPAQSRRTAPARAPHRSSLRNSLIHLLNAGLLCISLTGSAPPVEIDVASRNAWLHGGLASMQLEEGYGRPALPRLEEIAKHMRRYSPLPAALEPPLTVKQAVCELQQAVQDHNRRVKRKNKPARFYVEEKPLMQPLARLLEAVARERAPSGDWPTFQTLTSQVNEGFGHTSLLYPGTWINARSAASLPVGSTLFVEVHADDVPNKKDRRWVRRSTYPRVPYGYEAGVSNPKSGWVDLPQTALLEVALFPHLLTTPPDDLVRHLESWFPKLKEILQGKVGDMERITHIAQIAGHGGDNRDVAYKRRKPRIDPKTGEPMTEITTGTTTSFASPKAILLTRGSASCDM